MNLFREPYLFKLQGRSKFKFWALPLPLHVPLNHFCPLLLEVLLLEVQRRCRRGAFETREVCEIKPLKFWNLYGNFQHMPTRALGEAP